MEMEKRFSSQEIIGIDGVGIPCLWEILPENYYLAESMTSSDGAMVASIHEA